MRRRVAAAWNATRHANDRDRVCPQHLLGLRTHLLGHQGELDRGDRGERRCSWFVHFAPRSRRARKRRKSFLVRKIRHLVHALETRSVGGC